MEIVGKLVYADYRVNGKHTTVRLFVRTKKGVEVISDSSFMPYFYVVTDEKDEATKALGDKVSRIEEVERGCLKITVFTPPDVPALREKAADFGELREHDIPFIQRYMMDKALDPTVTYEWEVDEKNELRSFKPSKSNIELKAAAIDIETYNPHGMPNSRTDQIIMSSFCSEDEAKVLSTKAAKHKSLEHLKDEKHMLSRMCELVSDYDIVFTYNGDNFDLPYIEKRMAVQGVKEGLGRLGENITLKEGMTGTTAGIVGRTHMDVYQGVRFLAHIGSLRLQRYTLEEVYKAFTGTEKAEFDAKNMWKYWDEEKDLDKMAEYSLQDAQSTLYLGKEVLPLYNEIASMICQPLFDVNRMTSSQIVEKLLMKRCHEKGILAPNRPSGGEFESRIAGMIKGAYVKQPESGLHENLAVMDFRGLYPSLIISYNIDPNTLNCDCCKKDAYMSPNGYRFCKKHKGLVPEVLADAVEKRNKVKDLLKKTSKGSPDYLKLKNRNQALKVVNNSMYGYLNYARARWYSRECAEAITAWGREYIQNTDKALTKAGFEVLYGDSLTGERCVTVLDPQGHVIVEPIEELFNEHDNIVTSSGGKDYIAPRGYKALSVDPDSKAPAWMPIKAIMRHRAGKKIFRVGQKHGETRVTEDHSLIVDDGKFTECKPAELHNRKLAKLMDTPPVKRIEKLDMYELLKGYSFGSHYKGRVKVSKLSCDDSHVWFGWTERKERVKLKRFIQVGSEEFNALCRLLGAYVAEGSASTPETTVTHLGASIATSDVTWLRRLQKDYYMLFKNAKTCIIPSMPSERTLHYDGKTVRYKDGTHKLQMMNSISAVFFKMLCGQKSKQKKLPQFIFHVPNQYKRMLLDEMIKGDGSRRDKDKRYSKAYNVKNFGYDSSSLRLTSGLSFLLAQLDQCYTIRYRPNKGAYTIQTSSAHNKRLDTKILEEKYNGYVYDLSIDGSHMFVDACGQVLLHNTDSIFIKLGKKTKEDVLKFLKEYNSSLPGEMELELQGFYKRGLFVTKRAGGEAAKKRYALLGENGEIEIKGFEFVRRDWAPVAKKTQQKVIKAVLENRVEDAKKIVVDVIEKMRSGKMPVEMLVVSTPLTKKIESYDAVGPHVRAAMRLRENKEHVDKGTVVSYVIAQGSGRVGDRAYPVHLLGDRRYDADYYINNQILPAVMKILNELGISDDELKYRSKQAGLSKWF